MVLPVPTPIWGNIMVTTTPALADITIDGKPYGQTPNAIRNILEGEHKVEIRKYGYLAYSTTINVKEGQTVEVGGKLRNSDVEDSTLPSRPAIAKDIFDVVEEMPSFPDGKAALMAYLRKSIEYPLEALEKDAQGRVVCTFVVERDGSITDIRVLKSIDPSLDKEAVRVISEMPKWIPGKHKGKVVRVKYTMPVTFRL